MIAPAFTSRIAEFPKRSTFSIDFVAATIRRMTLRNIGLALLIGFPLTTFQQLARHFNLSPWQQDALRLLPRMLLPNGIAITIQCIVALLGILAADEAVHRGYSPLRSYATGALAGGTVGAVAAMLLGFLFEVPVGVVVLGGNARLQPAAVASLATLQIAFVALIYRRWATMRAAQRRRHQAELGRAETRRRALESSLQAMQARVEPEFLFSTLDRILRRFETQPARASATLDDLVDYLRAVLPQLRESTSTLGREAVLSQAFVNIVGARDDGATVLTIRMERATADATFPPMILLPLINAFLRAPDGELPVADAILLSAAIAKHSLHVTIDGPTGILRGDRCALLIEESTARLRALYGDAARLLVEHHWTDASRDGTRLRLELPYEAADRSHR
jgi:hypothetical protein